MIQRKWENDEKRVNINEDVYYFSTTPFVFILLAGARLVNMHISILIAALMSRTWDPPHTLRTTHFSPSHSFGSLTEARQSSSWDYYTTLGVIRDPVRHASKGSQVQQWGGDPRPLTTHSVSSYSTLPTPTGLKKCGQIFKVNYPNGFHEIPGKLNGIKCPVSNSLLSRSVVSGGFCWAVQCCYQIMHDDKSVWMHLPYGAGTVKP